ncbi:unnamed protein product [Hydatigera taeniaeformis]|uniref:MFS domain-containing protein n=1 Tax=Hydatigena taeniaeformis TaxID=6205 RepID=A0A0R3XDI6_HYDTA|nr:unnamed protein product [Hydatigera taeniaeformis]
MENVNGVVNCLIRGLILGVWNSHVSLGNIMGGLLAGIFVEFAWGWSFFLPGLLLVVMGLFVCLFLVPYPEDLGFQAPERIIKVGLLIIASHLMQIQCCVI